MKETGIAQYLRMTSAGQMTQREHVHSCLPRGEGKAQTRAGTTGPPAVR